MADIVRPDENGDHFPRVMQMRPVFYPPDEFFGLSWHVSETSLLAMGPTVCRRGSYLALDPGTATLNLPSDASE